MICLLTYFFLKHCHDMLWPEIKAWYAYYPMRPDQVKRR